MGHLEVEVKFLLGDLAAFRERLLAAGAVVHAPRIYERNLRLDTPEQGLLARRQLLRLRQDTAVRLTFKGEVPEAAFSEAKVYEELEVGVSDWETAVLLFTRLGYTPVQVYEKYRETFAWQEVEIVLDELPYGDFVELEGEEAALKTAVVTLGLDWSRRITTNYLALMAQLKNHHTLPFDDLTFANFQTTQARIADMLPQGYGD